MNKEFNSVENNREREYDLANELAKNIILKFLSGEYEEEEVDSEIEEIEEEIRSAEEQDRIAEEEEEDECDGGIITTEEFNPDDDDICMTTIMYNPNMDAVGLQIQYDTNQKDALIFMLAAVEAMCIDHYPGFNVKHFRICVADALINSIDVSKLEKEQ